MQYVNFIDMIHHVGCICQRTNEETLKRLYVGCCPPTTPIGKIDKKYFMAFEVLVL
jgi:hypothetical protein